MIFLIRRVTILLNLKSNFRKAQIYMVELSTHVRFSSGSPQFRIVETMDVKAPNYQIYSQNDLLHDLTGIKNSGVENKKVRTKDKVCTLSKGDILFSLISGTATIVGKEHEGYLYTQNYIKLFTDASINEKFLVYLLNENSFIKKQFQIGLQGSLVLKYTLKQLKEIQLPSLPSLERQKLIGEVYWKQMRVEALKHQLAKSETELIFRQLEEVIIYE